MINMSDRQQIGLRIWFDRTSGRYLYKDEHGDIHEFIGNTYITPDVESVDGGAATTVFVGNEQIDGGGA